MILFYGETIKLDTEAPNTEDLEINKTYTLLNPINYYESAVDAYNREDTKGLILANTKINIVFHSGKPYGIVILGKDTTVYYIYENNIILNKILKKDAQ